MDDRLQKVEELFHAALVLDLNQRDAFLSQASLATPEIIAQVRVLLQAHERAGNFLEAKPILTGLPFAALSESLLGQEIGHFKILSWLGSGGMGEVYLAEDTKLRRKVAIKSLGAVAVLADQSNKRLLREARAAAKLDHPNICSIYEIREDADRVFIVMQYIEGETLSSKLESQALGLSESLEVAIQIAEALAAAHGEGIIHRDIKPQNVVINRQGQVKVLDFGLAKMIGGDQNHEAAADPDSLISRENAIAGTPMYMSPEQVKGQHLDSRSDLFSLGVLLFECVTGRRPFSGGSAAEIFANVVHLDPPAASTFNPLIPPELDGLLFKALAKEAGERYISAGDMLVDLRRIRNVLPAAVELRRALPADRPRLQQRIITAIPSRFSRRGYLKIAALVAAVALLTVVWRALHLWPVAASQPSREALQWYESGTNAISWAAYYQATRALERAIRLDNRFALAHARLAEAWAELDYTERAKDELLLATALSRNGEALSQADSLYLDAMVATSRRDFKGAVAIYQTIAEQAAASEKQRAYLDLGRAHERNEDSQKALQSYLQATASDPRYAPAFLRLGNLYGRKHELKPAIEAFDAAEALYQDMGNQEGVAEVLYCRGALFNQMDRSAEAQAPLEKALAIADSSTLVSKHQQIKTRLQLSSVHYTEGHRAQAQQYATQAIELARDDQLENLAVSGLIELGNTYFIGGEYEEAKKYFRQASEFASQSRGRYNEARARLSLGSLLIQQNNPDEGLPLVEQAMVFYQQGGYYKEAVQAVSLLGRCYGQRGDYELALQSYQQQLDLAEQAGDQSQTALAHISLGSVLGFFQERYPEALTHFDESYRINTALGVRGSAGYDLVSRGSALWPVGRYEDAQAALIQAYAIAQNADSQDKYLMAWVCLFNARIALSKGRLDLARARGEQAFELSEASFKDIAVQAKMTLGLAEALAGRSDKGRLLCEAALDEATALRNPRYTSEALLALAEVLLICGDVHQALDKATAAQSSFARFGQQASEWQAAIIAAQAAYRAGEQPAAGQYIARALEILPLLEQRWGAEAYDGFLTRPDVQRHRRQLDQVLAASQ